jgi:hypothetical protein
MIDPLEEPTASVESVCGGVQIVVSWLWSRTTVPGGLDALGAGVAATAVAVVAMLLAADVAVPAAGGFADEEQPAASSATSRKDAHVPIRVADDGVAPVVMEAGSLRSVGLGAMAAG